MYKENNDNEDDNTDRQVGKDRQVHGWMGGRAYRHMYICTVTASYRDAMDKSNQSPKGIMRSAVSLPCFFDVVKSQRVAGQRPRQGTKSCRTGRNSVRPSIYPYVRPYIPTG